VHQHCPDAATVLVAGQVLEGHDVRTVSRMAYQPKG
jgi:hypothetical protein